MALHVMEEANRCLQCEKPAPSGDNRLSGRFCC